MADDAAATGAAKRERLAQRRKALGLTQEDLAGLLGVQRSTVVRWERGETEPLPWIRPKLAATLQVSADRIEELLTVGPAVRGPGTGAEAGLGGSSRKSEIAGCGKGQPPSCPVRPATVPIYPERTGVTLRRPHSPCVTPTVCEIETFPKGGLEP